MGLMDVVDIQGGAEVDGERGIRPWHIMGGLHKRGAAGSQSPDQPQDGASGDLWRGDGVQQEIPKGENPVAHTENRMQATTREKGSL